MSVTPDPAEKLAAWAETQPRDNYVYVMECGHEHDSPFRRTEGVFVRCSAHGQQRLVSGMFLAPAEECISTSCLYGDCDCTLAGCVCECHSEFDCDHNHGHVS